MERLFEGHYFAVSLDNGEQPCITSAGFSFHHHDAKRVMKEIKKAVAVVEAWEVEKYGCPLG